MLRLTAISLALALTSPAFGQPTVAPTRVAPVHVTTAKPGAAGIIGPVDNHSACPVRGAANSDAVGGGGSGGGSGAVGGGSGAAGAVGGGTPPPSPGVGGGSLQNQDCRGIIGPVDTHAIISPRDSHTLNKP